MMHDLDHYSVRIFEQEAIIASPVSHVVDAGAQQWNIQLPEMTRHDIDIRPVANRNGEVIEANAFTMVVPGAESILHLREHNDKTGAIGQAHETSCLAIGLREIEGSKCAEVKRP